jgi:hypothetical protein
LQGDDVTSVPARQLLRQLLADDRADILADDRAMRTLVDIGSSTVSGLRHPNPFRQAVAHPVQHTRILNAEQAAALGSDTVRAGWTFTAPTPDDAGSFTDTVGIRWAWSGCEPIALGHPLDQAGVRGIRRYPGPQWPDATPEHPSLVAPKHPCPEPGDCDTHLVVVEPPCPGMLELSMALRSPWQFLHDVTNGWRVAGALLDWSLETLLDAYARTVAQLPAPPDLLVYPDILGFRTGMYLSVSDFRNQLRPRLQILLTGLRRLSAAPILLCCQGAVGPVLTDLGALEPDLLHLERDLAGIALSRLRASISATTGLHGVVDLSIGRLVSGDYDLVAQTALLARAWPAVAAPLRTVDADVPPAVLARASSFVRSLTPATLRALRDEPDPTRLPALLFCQGTGVREHTVEQPAEHTVELDAGPERTLIFRCR